MDYRKIIFIGICLTTSFVCPEKAHSQKSIPNKIDSLQIELSNTKNDTSRILLYYEIVRTYDGWDDDSLDYYLNKLFTKSSNIAYKKGLALYYLTIGKVASRDSQYDEAILLFNKSLEYFLEINNTEKVAETHNHMGIAHYYKSNYVQALSNYSKSKSLYTSINDTLGIANSYNNIGIVFKTLGEYDSAYVYYFKSTELSSKMNDKKEISILYNNIANLKILLGQFDEASSFLKQAVAINHEANYQRGLAFNNENLGVLKFKQGLYKEARSHYNKAIELYEFSGIKNGVSDILKYQGQLEFKLKKYDKALAFYDKSLKVKHEIGNKLGEAQVLIEMAECLKEKGLSEKAVQKAEKGLLIAQNIGARLEAKKALEFLHREFSKTQDFNKAYDYLNKYNKYVDSLMNDQKAIDIQRVESRYVLGQIQKENELLQKERDIRSIQLQQSNLELQNQKSILIALFLSLALALIATGFWYMYTIRKSKTIFLLRGLNDEINQQKEKIELQTKELQKAHIEVKTMNESLEDLVKERTEKVQIQNIKLRDYAFGNSHQMKKPLNRLLELADLSKLNDSNSEEKNDILNQIKISAEEIDGITRNLNELLREERL